MPVLYYAEICRVGNGGNFLQVLLVNFFSSLFVLYVDVFLINLGVDLKMVTKVVVFFFFFFFFFFFLFCLLLLLLLVYG